MPQSLARIYVHIVFSTKNRMKHLTGESIRKEMWKYLVSVFGHSDSPAIEIGGMHDHVHAQCTISKNHSLAAIIREVKRKSSRWIKDKGDKYKDFQWQRG